MKFSDGCRFGIEPRALANTSPRNMANTDKGKWSGLRLAKRTELVLAKPNKSQEILGIHASSRR